MHGDLESIWQVIKVAISLKQPFHNKPTKCPLTLKIIGHNLSSLQSSLCLVDYLHLTIKLEKIDQLTMTWSFKKSMSFKCFKYNHDLSRKARVLFGPHLTNLSPKSLNWQDHLVVKIVKIGKTPWLSFYNRIHAWGTPQISTCDNKKAAYVCDLEYRVQKYCTSKT